MLAKWKYELQGFLWNPNIHVFDIYGLHIHGHRTDSRPTTDESRGGHRISAKGSLTSEAMRKLSFAPCSSKLLLTGRLVPFTTRLGLRAKPHVRLNSFVSLVQEVMALVYSETAGHSSTIFLGYRTMRKSFQNSLSKRPLLIRLGLTSLLLLPESLALNLARIRLSLKRLLLIGLTSLTLVVYYEF